MPVAFCAAWLRRSFTLNALVNITAALASDICAFGDYLSSPSAAFAEATAPKGKDDPPLVELGAAGFPKIFFCFYRKHVREITT